jgi:hypothetical protein
LPSRVVFPLTPFGTIAPAKEMSSTNHHDESFSIAVCIDAKKKSMLGEMFADAIRPAFCV